MPLHDRVADVGAGVAAGGSLLGSSIGHINQYLQAGAFIVAMISGAAAAVYHISQWRKNRKR